MTQTPIALAVPGDINTLTGGYIYDRQLYDELCRADYDMILVTLPNSFPFPPAADLARACAQLQALPAGTAVIIDGLAFGALPPEEVAKIVAPIIALVHHPLAFESALPTAQQEHFLKNERENLRYAAQVLVPSPHTKATLIAHFEVDAARIHIALPGIAQLSQERPPVPRPARPLILSVGILHPRKGHDVLIDALGYIEELEWDACIVGGVWEEGYDTALQDQIDRQGLTARVRLAGRVEGAELSMLYSQASLFALATRYEGYGMVFNEAMIHGLPIVSCATGAVPDTVPQGAGLLTAIEDPAAFGAALSQVLSDSTVAANMRAAAVRAAKALGTWEDTASVASRAIHAARKAIS
ncbi:glycosyltransferase family 4 protein [Roseicitreum antarcticum]|uniref:Glycosyl transferases group 1 n=1 Tax=Roseicitreum antarcticum TaxID=564137 RepID=A0A1H2TIM9_9RHOB|nr:glycosyltransferase family 4 protein [Roseicitreum antarcticum]SDW43114.1 Glycosyl transferases group 1 [Roseicitreum antarcticum]